jgi:hypothetical protein
VNVRIISRCLVASVFLFFAVVLTYHACQYGRQWHFVYATPELIVAEDGHSYPDGTAVNPFDLALYRSGYERVFYLIIYAVALYVIAPGVPSLWRFLFSPLRR